MEEDSGSILCQISSYKDMLDQVNEDIEANIQKTVSIESEIVRCCEVEKTYLMKESELMKMVFAGEFELNGLTEVGAIMKTSLGQMEKELTLVRLDRENTVKRICQKREKFIMECKQFQENIVKEENVEFLALLSEKEALENEKQKLISKLNALKNSTSEFIEDVLWDLHNSTSALQVEIQHTSLKNKKVLKDIHELKGLLLKLA